jgi:transcriptional regulator with PAS, ATPase and Fis domain
MFGHTKGAFTGATANKEGLFETASGGTLFLDEMCSMPLVIQGKLLRVLQEKEIRRVGGTANIPVDVRVLVASTRNLEDLVRSGAFRQDLFYRLAVITIDIHPLRERKEDILPLVHYYLRHATPEGQPLPVVSREAGDILMAYHWPGNVRELENAIQHALTFARDSQITADVLPPKIIKETQASGRVLVESNNGAAYRNLSLKAYLRQKEKEYLAQVLESVNGDKEKAAQTMKISLATLYRKLPDETNS